MAKKTVRVFEAATDDQDLLLRLLIAVLDQTGEVEINTDEDPSEGKELRMRLNVPGRRDKLVLAVEDETDVPSGTVIKEA